MEKPIERDFKPPPSLVQICAQAGVPLAIMLQHRAREASQALKSGPRSRGVGRNLHGGSARALVAGAKLLRRTGPRHLWARWWRRDDFTGDPYARFGHLVAGPGPVGASDDAANCASHI